MEELSWRHRALAAVYHLTFCVWVAGLYIAGLGHRSGAYVLLGGFTAYHAIHWILAVAGAREAGLRLWPEFGLRRECVLEWLYAAVLAVLTTGVLIGMTGEDVATYPLVIGFVGRVVLDLLVGAAEYRAVMSRPWPAVTPLDDDDEW